MTIDQRSFRDAYGVLQKHADTLRDQQEPNIDDLLTIVTESVEAYNVCKARIDAVEAALKAALDGAGTPAAPPGSGVPERASDSAGTKAPASGRAAPPPAGVESDEDDIPF